MVTRREGRRDKRTRSRNVNVMQALVRRQALGGRKGRLPSSHGLPRAPARLVYSISNMIPLGQRHERVILGFTADGEHVVVCCGPLSSPERLELRRVGLQWPGLSRPGEALWSLPLKNQTRRGDTREDNTHARQDVGSSDSGDDGGLEELDEEDAEEEEEEHELPGMGGFGAEDPANVAITESADGFLVVAVVSPNDAPEIHEDEDKVYHVFVAPGPAYTAAVHASVETPFVGMAFSYIVPGGGDGAASARVPSIAAHDVGVVGEDAEREGGIGIGHERVYVIVLNAVDAIRAIEVRLHTTGGQNSSALPGGKHPACPSSERRSPLPPGTQFTMQPPPYFDRAGGEIVGGGGGGGSSGNSSNSGDCCNVDPHTVWWSRGRDLPSTPLVDVGPLACCRTRATAAEATPAASAQQQGNEVRRESTRGGEEAATSAAAASRSGGYAVEMGGTEGGSPENRGRRACGGGGGGDGGGRAGEPRLTVAVSSGDDGGVWMRAAGGNRESAARMTRAVEGGSAPTAPATPRAQERAAARAAGAAVQRNARGRRRKRRRKAHASADRARQGVLDLEVFISQLLLRREAFPEQQQQQHLPLTPRQPQERDASGAAKAASSPFESSLSSANAATVGGEGSASRRRVEHSSVNHHQDGSKAPPGVDAVAVGGDGCWRHAEEVPSTVPPVLTTDYHCVTVGLMDGGHRVLLCLVVQVSYPRARFGKRRREFGSVTAAGGGETETGSRAGGGAGGAAGAGAGAAEKDSRVLGYMLALDLATGEVAVLETRSAWVSSDGSKRCAPLCETLARSVRRSGAIFADRPGRRLSNANVVQGRSLGAVINPVYPVAIVAGGEEA